MENVSREAVRIRRSKVSQKLAQQRYVGAMRNGFLFLVPLLWLLSCCLIERRKLLPYLSDGCRRNSTLTTNQDVQLLPSYVTAGTPDLLFFTSSAPPSQRRGAYGFSRSGGRS
jgi:cellobiose-specific phosphotransferase system component IIC